MGAVFKTAPICVVTEGVSDRLTRSQPTTGDKPLILAIRVLLGGRAKVRPTFACDLGQIGL